MSLKDMSKLPLWQPLCLVERNHLCYFGRRHYEEQFCDFFLNLDQWFRRRRRLIYFLYGALGALFSVECNHLCNFGRGHYEEQFCEFI